MGLGKINIIEEPLDRFGFRPRSDVVDIEADAQESTAANTPTAKQLDMSED